MKSHSLILVEKLFFFSLHDNYNIFFFFVDFVKIAKGHVQGEYCDS